LAEQAGHLAHRSGDHKLAGFFALVEFDQIPDPLTVDMVLRVVVSRFGVSSEMGRLCRAMRSLLTGPMGEPQHHKQQHNKNDIKQTGASTPSDFERRFNVFKDAWFRHMERTDYGQDV